MSAQPKPDPTEVADGFVDKFRKSYETAMERAREAERTTSTPAWIANYKVQMKDHKTAIQGAMSQIVEACNRIKVSDSTEDEEKLIRESAKDMNDERIRFIAWQHRAVKVYRASVDALDGIRESVIADASNEERKNPLINSGLSDAVKAIVNRWSKAKWDEVDGTVTVND